MRKFIQGLVAGVMMLLMSLAAFGMSIAQSPANALRDAGGVWSVDAQGKWMFCVFVANDDATELEAAKCFKVPDAVSNTRQARM
jgi:hypothetical protein